MPYVAVWMLYIQRMIDKRYWIFKSASLEILGFKFGRDSLRFAGNSLLLAGR